MTRRGFLTAIASLAADPHAVADVAAAGAAQAAAAKAIAAADAKFAAAVKDMFAAADNDMAFHDINPHRGYTLRGIYGAYRPGTWTQGPAPGATVAWVFLNDLKAYDREGRLDERMAEIEAHEETLRELAPDGSFEEIRLTRAWLEEFYRRHKDETRDTHDTHETEGT